MEEMEKKISEAFALGMGVDLDITKGRKKALLVLEQHPDYRSALYPALGDYYGLSGFDYIDKELERSGFSEDMNGVTVFHTVSDMMDWLNSLKKSGFRIDLTA